MSYTLSPSMLLRIPDIGDDAGPDYAENLNFDLLSVIDAHDHTPGRGLQITPAGMNINVDLDFNGQFATDLAGLTLLAQGSTPTLSTIYRSGLDLYYVDGVGNNVRLTQSGGVAAAPGGITNLAAPASVTYVSGNQTFVFQSNVSVAANIDAGSILFRNLTPNSTFAVTLSAPAALASNYSLTLPTIPGANSFLQINTSGAIVGSIPVLGTLDTTNLAASAGILGTQIAANTIADSNIIAGTITGTSIAGATIAGGNLINGTVTGQQIASSVGLTGQPTIDGVYAVAVHANDASAMHMLAGGVDAAGNLLFGAGFSTSVTAGPAPGAFTTNIAYIQPFGAIPAVCVQFVSPTVAGDVAAPKVFNSSTAGFSVLLWDVQANAQSNGAPFTFIVAGRR